MLVYIDSYHKGQLGARCKPPTCGKIHLHGKYSRANSWCEVSIGLHIRPMTTYCDELCAE